MPAEDFFYSQLGDLCPGKAGVELPHKHTKPAAPAQHLALTDLCVLLRHK